MTPTHLPYPSTPSWNMLQANFDFDYDDVFPKTPVELFGTVKIHGSNISLVYKNGQHHIQSRNKIINVNDDMQGAAKWLQPKIPAIHDMLISLYPTEPPLEQYAIYGEFAGRGIQKTVGVAKLPVFFMIFAVMINGEFQAEREWQDLKIPNERIWNVHDFETFRVVVDWSSRQAMEDSYGELMRLTLEVERECPVAKKVGGLEEGVGEGIVWMTILDGRPLNFKTKGKEHVSRLKKQERPVESQDTAEIERFVEEVLTPGRLAQGFEYLLEMNIPFVMASVWHYVKWVVDDIIKEEQHLLQDMECKFESSPAKKRVVALTLAHFKEVLAAKE